MLKHPDMMLNEVSKSKFSALLLITCYRNKEIQHLWFPFENLFMGYPLTFFLQIFFSQRKIRKKGLQLIFFQAVFRQSELRRLERQVHKKTSKISRFQPPPYSLKTFVMTNSQSLLPTLSQACGPIHVTMMIN